MKSIWQRPHIFQIVALVAYTLLAVVMTLPLAFQMSDHLLGTDSNALNDTYFSVWIFGWQAKQLLTDPLHLFQGNIFYPFANTLAFSEIILPGALLYLPFAYATNNPIFAYNLVVLLTFPLNAFAMYLLALDWMKKATDDARRTTDRNTQIAAFIAGLIFAFSTYKLGELRHVQLLMAMFMPLTLMYVARFMRAPNSRNAFFTALFFALNALSSLYYAVFLAFAIALYVVIDLVRRRFRLTRAHVLYGIASGIIAALIVLPFLLPFFQLERQYNFSEGRDPNLFSARPASYLAATNTQWLYGKATRAFYVASKGQPLFPGIAATLLAVFGVVMLIRQNNRAWIFLVLLALMGIILSFGPALILGRESIAALPVPMPYHYLQKIVTPLKSLNAPARFAVLTTMALALLAAYGARALMQRSARWGGAIALVCAVVILLEYIPAPLKLVRVENNATINPAYTFLAQQPRGQAVIELPMGGPIFAEQDKYLVYTYASLYHLQPLINGYSTFIPTDYYALAKDMQAFPAPKTIARLKEYGAQWLVVHSQNYPKPDALREQLNKRDGLAHVQDFGTTWLYRVK
jgi:hypothetical protein